MCHEPSTIVYYYSDRDQQLQTILARLTKCSFPVTKYWPLGRYLRPTYKNEDTKEKHKRVAQKTIQCTNMDYLIMKYYKTTEIY